jgi:hypothetical protein
MSRIPILGSQQLDVRMDGSAPRLRTKSLLCWRSWDGRILPVNDGISCGYLGRSTTATIYDSYGTSGALVASALAFSCVDWDGDGVREEDALLLSDEEALRFYDANTNRLTWKTDAKVIRLDWLQVGDIVADQPLFTFTRDNGTGAYFGLFGGPDGTVQFRHYNGTSTVTSERPVFDGDRCSARALLFSSGAVQLGLVRNGSAESVGTKSSALEPAADWGNGGATVARLNEFGDSDRGTMLARYLAVYGGNATRKQLLEVL